MCVCVCVCGVRLLDSKQIPTHDIPRTRHPGCSEGRGCGGERRRGVELEAESQVIHKCYIAFVKNHIYQSSHYHLQLQKAHIELKSQEEAAKACKEEVCLELLAGGLCPPLSPCERNLALSQ